jgi:hypothetical protein
MRCAARRTIFACLFFAAVGLAPRASAQSAEDVATAKAAILQARELRAQGDYQNALPKFQAAYALVPTPLTGVDYGTTLVQLGRLVEAHEVFVAVTKMPGEGSEDGVHAKARAQAADLATQLQTRIPSLTISVAGAPPGAAARVAVDSHDVPLAALSVPRRLNPGKHSVTASADGVPSKSVDVDLEEGESKQVTLDLSPAAPPTAPPMPPPATASEQPQPPMPTAPDHAQGGLGGRKVIALVVGGAGVVAAGIGAFLNLSGKSSYEDAVSHCANNLCAPADASSASSAATQGTVGMIVLGAGVLAVAGGVVLWLTAPHVASGSSVGVAVAPNGVTLRGAF